MSRLIDSVIEDDNDWGLDDIPQEYDISTHLYQEDAEEELKRVREEDENKAKKIAKEIESKGIVQTSTKESININKDDNPSEYLLKRINTLEDRISKMDTSMRANKVIEDRRRKEWEKMKEVSLDANTLINNIKNGLGNSDISDKDINEITSRVESRVLKKISVKPDAKDVAPSNNISFPKKYYKMAIVLAVLAVISAFTFKSIYASEDKVLRHTADIKSGSIVYCRSSNDTDGKFRQYTIGDTLKNITGKVTSDNKFYFNYKKLICTIPSNELS